MKKYKDGTVIKKEFSDMDVEELQNVDILSLNEVSDEEFSEFVKWKAIREEERMRCLYY